MGRPAPKVARRLAADGRLDGLRPADLELVGEQREGVGAGVGVVAVDVYAGCAGAAGVDIGALVGNPLGCGRAQVLGGAVVAVDWARGAGGGGDEDLDVAQAVRLGVRVVVGPGRGAGQAPGVDGGAAAGGHHDAGDRPAQGAGADRAARVGGGGTEALRGVAGDVEGGGAGGGQTGDGVAPGAVEFGIDERRQLVGHVGVPLVNAQDGIRGIPVGVEGISAADGHDNVDVLAGEPRADVGVAHPVHALLAALDAGQQVEGAARLVAAGQQHVIGDNGAVGRGPDVHLPEVAVDVALVHDLRLVAQPGLLALVAGQLEGAVDETRLGLGGRGGRAGEAEPQGGDRGEGGG